MSHVSSLSAPIAGCTLVASTPGDGAGEPAGPGPGAGRRVGNPDAEKLGDETDPEEPVEPKDAAEPEDAEEPEEPEESEEPEEEADPGGVNPAGGGALSTGNVSPHSSQNPPICPVAPQASQVLGADGIIDFLP